MKRVVFAILTLCVICQSASAQEWIGTNRDDFGRVVYGSYLTNKWYDNWYIGGAVGVASSFSRVHNPRVSPQFDITLLKWFTPSVGARFGFQGFSGKEYLTINYNPYLINHSPLPFDSPHGNPGTLSYGLAYFHGDLFLNLMNAFSGYKHDRFAEVSLYANAGYCRLYDNTKGEGFGSKNCDNEFAFGLGLYTTLRITERLVGTIDLRHFSTASRYKTLDGVRTHRLSLTFGVSYNLYKTYWNRAQTIIRENNTSKVDAATAKAALASAEKTIERMKQKIEEQKTENKATSENLEVALEQLDHSNHVIELSYKALKEKADAAELVLYYYTNVDKLNFSELHHLDEYIQRKLKEDPDHVFYLTGSADKGTGTMDRNKVLCRNRAYGVRDILVKDYKVKPEHVIIKATIVSDKHLDGALDRCVLIESK